jgi:hypothetical protein
MSGIFSPSNNSFTSTNYSSVTEGKQYYSTGLLTQRPLPFAPLEIRPAGRIQGSLARTGKHGEARFALAVDG